VKEEQREGRVIIKRWKRKRRKGKEIQVRTGLKRAHKINDTPLHFQQAFPPVLVQYWCP
jgi:hypothetical protein